MKRKLRVGFTLVELLVVIAIIGILIALLLPAIQAAREAARRSQCTNNLKQLGIALHNYHDVYSRFAPNYGGVNWPSTGWTPERGTTLVRLLPYMEQAAIYNQINFVTPYLTIDNIKLSNGKLARSTVISQYRCPSAQSPLMSSYDLSIANTNYATCMGPQSLSDNSCNIYAYTGPSLYPGGSLNNGWFNDCQVGGGNNEGWAWSAEGQNVAGVFARTGTADGGNNGANYAPSGDPNDIWIWAAAIKDIPDGTANTIAMCEARPECDNWLGRGGWYRSIDSMGIHTVSPINWPTCPNEPGYTTSNACFYDWGAYSAVHGAKSKHPGGALFVYADGSVHFLQETINYDLYQRLGDRHDGRSVSQDASAVTQ